MTPKPKYDVALIGGGIMSATLATMLHEFDNSLEIVIFERLSEVAKESSSAWNNAGTGHSAFCELNYTPEKDGQIDIKKAEYIAEQFEVSKQFWSYLINKGIIDNPKEFINSCPHMRTAISAACLPVTASWCMTCSWMYSGTPSFHSFAPLIPAVLHSRI